MRPCGRVGCKGATDCTIVCRLRWTKCERAFFSRPFFWGRENKNYKGSFTLPLESSGKIKFYFLLYPPPPPPQKKKEKNGRDNKKLQCSAVRIEAGVKFTSDLRLVVVFQRLSTSFPPPPPPIQMTNHGFVYNGI